MELEVKGHSGCQIDVVREGSKLFIHKSTQDPKYLKRLVLQAEKQQEATKQEYQHIRVPKIHAIDTTPESVVVKMDYVYSRNFIEYFEQAGFEQIEYLVSALIMYLEREISESQMEIVSSKILTDKFADVKSKTFSQPLLKDDKETKQILDKSEEIFDALPDMSIPVGRCHGDLTFSNILFNGNNYYLIDFLDSFIESPLLDIVKIRQDTAWMWSQLMYTKPFDKVRLGIVSRKIDKEIDRYFFEKYDWYRAYYKPLQLMNFLRILQYGKDTKVISYLKDVLNKLLIQNP